MPGRVAHQLLSQHNPAETANMLHIKAQSVGNRALISRILSRYQLSIPFVFDDDDECEWQQNTESEIEWTGDEIVHLCDCLLEDSIRTLFDARTSDFSRQEIISWMLEGDDSEPFSFVACCTAADVNPNDLNTLVLKRLRQFA
jgi:hypothetical protein